MAEAPRFASPVDVERFGPYRVSAAPGDVRPWLRFASRITANGSSGFLADAGRYHLYAGSFCPYAQRVLIARRLSGLSDDQVSVSFVDPARDARGWAFRARLGPDPINGFELLRDAYEATEPGFDGHVSVPTLWDRVQHRVVSNDYRTIEIDLATQFRAITEPIVELYPESRRFEIDELDTWLSHAVDVGTRVAARTGEAAELAGRELRAAFASLDERLGVNQFLLGNELTLADVRLFVTLVRFDAGANATRSITAGLEQYPNLWSYARALFRVPAFHATTDFSSFAAPEARLERWDEHSARRTLAEVPV